MFRIVGHHHISMITKDANINNYFYETILGMRRVKVSVNQDDPSMYHLFYGDLTGSPGTELTFFEMPYVGRTHRGTNAITQIGLVVPSLESLTYWQDRLDAFDVKRGEITTYAQRQALPFEDRDGLRLIFLVDETAELDEWQAWEASPVPVAHQVRGMGAVEITVKRLNKLTRTLTEVFGYEVVDQSADQVIFQIENKGVFSEIIALEKDGPVEKPGQGSIHHLAIAAKDDVGLAYWDAQVKKRGFESSGIIDRHYFQSIYFRESNGIVFEIATLEPGFTVDSSVEMLGSRLDLPPFLEKRREEIKNVLPPLKGVDL